MTLTIKAICTISVCLRYDLDFELRNSKSCPEIYHADILPIGSYGYGNLLKTFTSTYNAHASGSTNVYDLTGLIQDMEDLLYTKWWHGQVSYDEVQNTITLLEMQQ